MPVAVPTDADSTIDKRALVCQSPASTWSFLAGDRVPTPMLFSTPGFVPSDSLLPVTDLQVHFTIDTNRVSVIVIDRK